MQAVHFVPAYLLNPTNPIVVNLIGAGGTGSHMLTALVKMNEALNCMGHPGLHVRVFDDDIVSEANLGRQLFFRPEVGLYKSVAIVNRINRAFGTSWKAVCERYGDNVSDRNCLRASITISCVDTVDARVEIANILSSFSKSGKYYSRDASFYWLDFGNSKETGQAILATVGTIEQPKSRKFKTVGKLQFVTEEFGALLRESETNDNTPSCSLAEALEKQDLFINPALANIGASLLWQIFREGMICDRGFFMNLKTFRTQPLKVA